MIEVYNKSNSNFDFNGDMILKPSLCDIEVELNGIIEVTLEHPYDKEGRWKYIIEDNILRVPYPWKEEGQLFYIYDKEKGMTGVRCKARHIFFDLAGEVLIDCRPTNATGQEALNKILEGTGFIGHSNIITRNSAYYIRKHIANEALISEDENSFINRWGGELDVDNFHVYMNERTGGEYGVTFRYGQDLIDLKENSNIDGIITRILPVGFNGITIPEHYVDSPLINKYRKVKADVIKFDHIKVKESPEDEEGYNTLEEAQEALREACKQMFDEGIDKLLYQIDVEVAMLEHTLNYKESKNLLEVGLGDTVGVEHLGIGINIKTRVIKFVYDCISEKFKNITLGNYIENYIDTQNNTDNILNRILNNDGTVNAIEVAGVLNAINVKMRAMKDIAQKQDVRALLCEDLDPESPTYGAMCYGTMGFMIASERTPDGRDWDWRTFGTGKGFIADHIIAGILSAVLIRNLDGSFEIDLSKTGGALFKNNGKDAIRIENNSIMLYNWAKEGDYIGALTSLVRTDDSTKPMIGLVNDIDSALSIGYQHKGKDGEEFKSYIEFDKYGVLERQNPISILQNMGMMNYIMNFGKNNEHSLYNSVFNNLCISHTGNLLFVDKTTGKTYFEIGLDEFTFYDESGQKFFWKDKGRKNFSINGDLEINGEVTGVIRNFQGDVIYDSNNPGGNGGGAEQNSIIESARKLIGKPYVWGGNYPPLGSSAGTDCSGLCQWAYNDNGISISRTTYTQINEGIEVTVNDLQPGDLVFSNFSSPGVPEHVYLYSGKNSDGQLMCVEAPRTGLNIRERVFTWTSSMRARRILSTKALINENVELKNKILNIEERLSNLEEL